MIRVSQVTGILLGGATILLADLTFLRLFREERLPAAAAALFNEAVSA